MRQLYPRYASGTGSLTTNGCVTPEQRFELLVAGGIDWWLLTSATREPAVLRSAAPSDVL